ncbi:MAG TPA: hypothetical protein PK303_04345 [bacterium]|nr:hypothetical protein [bacterium]HPP08335.1 hypothetical protein [bacterium]
MTCISINQSEKTIVIGIFHTHPPEIKQNFTMRYKKQPITAEAILLISVSILKEENIYHTVPRASISPPGLSPVVIEYIILHRKTIKKNGNTFLLKAT